MFAVRWGNVSSVLAAAPSLLAFTGGQWILLLCFIIPVAILWGYALVSLVRRHDLGIGAKLLWAIGMLVVPVIGATVYFMLRPAPQEQNRRAQARHRH